MTNVFNVFTVMQIFNLVNARKIHDEKNIFDGIFRSSMFIGVLLGICAGQVLIIEVGREAMKVNEHGCSI